MSAFLRTVRRVNASEVNAGMMIECNDGVPRTVKTVKSFFGAGASQVVVGFANTKRTDAYIASDVIKVII